MTRPADPARTSVADLVIRGAAVVNPRDGSLQVNQDVHIAGERVLEEFDELARAGLPPLRILQMTTSDAADFLAAADVMGSVAPGKYADLVLLDGNPVESADHLHRISGVVRGGRYYPRAELDALKEGTAAGRSVR